MSDQKSVLGDLDHLHIDDSRDATKMSVSPEERNNTTVSAIPKSFDDLVRGKVAEWMVHVVGYLQVTTKVYFPYDYYSEKCRLLRNMAQVFVSDPKNNLCKEPDDVPLLVSRFYAHGQTFFEHVLLSAFHQRFPEIEYSELRSMWTPSPISFDRPTAGTSGDLWSHRGGRGGVGRGGGGRGGFRGGHRHVPY